MSQVEGAQTPTMRSAVQRRIVLIATKSRFMFLPLIHFQTRIAPASASEKLGPPNLLAKGGRRCLPCCELFQAHHRSWTLSCRRKATMRSYRPVDPDPGLGAGFFTWFSAAFGRALVDCEEDPRSGQSYEHLRGLDSQSPGILGHPFCVTCRPISTA